MSDNTATNLEYSCIQTGIRWAPTARELDFYQRMEIPQPQLCPQERLRIRLAYNNPFSVWRRKSDSSENLIFSMYPEQAPFPVVDKDYWWGDAWDPLAYGRPYDFSYSFFDNFAALSRQVPHFPLSVVRTEDSEFVNNATGLSRCYMHLGGIESQDCMYCDFTSFSRSCMECSRVDHSELCYDCVLCEHCYDLQSSLHCDNCSSSKYLRHCSSCKNCFGCTNLTHAEYRIFNQQYSPEQYHEYLKSLNLRSYQGRAAIEQQVFSFWVSQPVPCLTIYNSNDVIGDFIWDSTEIETSFFIWDSSKISHGFQVLSARDAVDFSFWGNKAELIYNCSLCGNQAYNLICCYECFENVADLSYCQFCLNSRDCFGCVGLRHKQFCILNKQYTESEYRTLKAQIIQQMRQRGEYGNFFPIEHSPVPYNHSFSQLYFPRTQSEALQQKLYWYEKPAETGPQCVLAQDLPDQAPIEPRSLVVASAESGKAFKITQQEMKRCYEFAVPLPRITYRERSQRRTSRFNQPFLYQRLSAFSQQPLITSFPESSPAVVWGLEEWVKQYRS